ncbi:MAG: transaldolase [Aquiluna sp.]
MNERLKDLTAAGVSIWLDDLSRERIESGNLQDLIENYSVRGVTTNPTIFAQALSSDSYSPAIAAEKVAGSDASKTIFNLTTEDVANACSIFEGVYSATAGVDGRVSIEVEPGLAHDARATIAQAKELYAKVNRENVMIKIPATIAGLQAITEVTAAGISVNVTLIFSVERYEAVIDAYMSGLERALEAGVDVSKIHSVASFFVSRVDTEVDKRLEGLGRADLKSKAALANARLAYELYQTQFASERWQALSQQGARIQRPLMASTGVKDPNLPDTLYVTELVAADVVNTMPEKTMMATADHGEIPGNSIVPNIADAKQVMQDLADAGIDFADVTEGLESEGVQKFIDSWDDLVATVTSALDNA